MKKAILYLLTLALFTSCSAEKGNSQNDNLVGPWKLMAFVDETNNTSIMEKDFENTGPFFIDFKENFNIRGNTFRNNVFGKYALKDSGKTLILLEFGTDTEINETDWGFLFFEKLHLNYDPATKHYVNAFELLGNELKLYYTENEYMKFDKM